MALLVTCMAILIMLSCSKGIVRIGLPDEHVDTNSCWDRACISEHDWLEIGEKWQNFKEIVDVMDKSNSSDIRAAIWRTFQNGDIWGRDERARGTVLKDLSNMRYTMDKKTEEIRKFLSKEPLTRYDNQAIIVMEGDTTVEKAAHFLYNKHPESSALYVYNPETGILTLEVGEKRVIGKNSRVQIVGHGRDATGVMTLSEKSPSELAEIVSKLPIKGSEIGRISLVGCNIASGGQSKFLNDGYTERFLKSLFREQGIQTEISSRNGLVSVTSLGRKETGEITPNGIQWFSKDPLTKTIIKLGQYGEIERLELPLTERIATFNEDSSGSLIKIQDIDETINDNIKPLYVEKVNVDTNMLEQMNMMKVDDIGEYIKTATSNTFLDESSFIEQQIINKNENIVKVKQEIEKVTGQKINDHLIIATDSIKKTTVENKNRMIEYFQFSGNLILLDVVTKQSLSSKYKFELEFHETGYLKMTLTDPHAKFRRSIILESGISGDWKYVASLDPVTGTKEFRVEKVRTIVNRNDLLYEINMLGTFGIDRRNAEKLYRYYRFGDVVYRMDRSTFYIHWDGMVASDEPVISTHLNKHLTEKDLLHPKPWLWKDRYNRDEIPRNYDKESYPDMKRVLEYNYADSVIDSMIESLRNEGNWVTYDTSQRKVIEEETVSFSLKVNGKQTRYTRPYSSDNVLGLMESFIKGEQIALSTKLTHVLEGSTTLAIALSEPIRNYRCYFMNDMIIHLNKQETISLRRLIEVHPMTRKGSWGFPGQTGLSDNSLGYKQNKARIVLQRELNVARTFLLLRQGEDGKSKYRFITESEYRDIERSKPAGEVAKITTYLNSEDVRGTIADFKPESNELFIRTRPLGCTEPPSINTLRELSQVSETKSFPVRASASMVYDYVYITNYISKIIAEKSRVLGRDLEIIENSIEVNKGNIRFKIGDPSYPDFEENVKISLEEDVLSSNAIKEESSDRIGQIRKSPSNVLMQANTYLGIYGIVMGFRGAVQDFEDGKLFEGIMNIAQSIHGLAGMSATAQRAFQSITSKILSTGLQEVETGLSAVSTEIGTGLSEGGIVAEETAVATAGEVAGDIPVLGTVFGVYNCVQDIRRGTAIGYVDAALDAAILISTLFGPEALVVTVALTVVRLVIDDFYYAISNELKQLPPNATTLQKIGAVLKGLAEGLVMVVKNIADFLSLGFLSFIETSDKIDKQYQKDHDFFHKMSDYHNYFKVEKEDGSSNKLIDFASGEESWNGGNVVFHLFEGNTARLQMQIVDEDGQQKYLDKYITLEQGADDIVLGIGESHEISFKKQSAKIFWFIPVHSKYLMDKVRGERETLHGTYYGNSRSNKFFAVQKLPEGVDLGYSLNDYFYEIYGEDGDDVFYLGPQKSKICGGNGHDTYIIPETGGATVIDNDASDLSEDTLFIQVDFNKLHVDRYDKSLILKHGSHHDITIIDWFSGHRKGHMTFRANQGVIFNVTVGVYSQPALLPLAIIRSGDSEDHIIDVSEGIWENVVMVTGGDGSDHIIGNKNDNLINGGKGRNKMKGEAGSDTYIVNSVEVVESAEWNEIDNFDEKMTVDKVIFDIPYNTIQAAKIGQDVTLSTSMRNGPNIRLLRWFESEHYRHMLFITSDDVIFKLTDDINDRNLKQPIILDGSKEKASVHFDTSISDLQNVSTLIGSDFDDVILGNNANNYIKGGRGSDYLMGGEGRDVYVLRQEDTGDFINNFSQDKKEDLLLADFNYDDIEVLTDASDVMLVVALRRIVTIKSWMEGEEWQHFVIRTIDGITFKLQQDSFHNVRKSPVEVDKSGEKTSQEINTNRRSMNTVEYIIGSNATDYLSGNDMSNRIDPGYGGAYMLGLGGHDQYVVKEGYIGPNIINNFARDNLTDVLKLPEFFGFVTANVSNNNIIISCQRAGPSVTIENYVTNALNRHLLIQSVKDGTEFTLPEGKNFQPTPISINRQEQAHNLIVDLKSDSIWDEVVTVVGTSDHANVLRGNSNNNTLTGGRLSDTLEGRDGNDVIRGEEGEDFIDGGDGDDILLGGAGNDWIYGGMGDDVIYPGPGSDHVNGGPGFDVVVLFGDPTTTSGVFVDLLNGHGYGGDAGGDIFVSVEGIIGGFYSDFLVGDHDDNYLDGKENNDLLSPLDGKDILMGGEGSDIYDIATAKGEKLINNKARDFAMDTINLKFYANNSVYLEKRSQDLIIHVGGYISGIFCPKLNTGPMHVISWYEDRSYQHITAEFADFRLVLDHFQTSGFEVNMVRPDTKEREETCKRLMTEVIGYSDDYLYYGDYVL